MVIKRYYLVNRTVIKEEYTDQEVYFEDEVIRIFNDENDILNFISNELFKNYTGLPKISVNISDLVGLTIDDLQEIKNERIKTKGLLSLCNEGFPGVVEQYKNINKAKSCKSLIKNGNLFNEVLFNEESKQFFKNNIIDYGNRFGRIFNIPLVKDRFGNWIEWKNQALI